MLLAVRDIGRGDEPQRKPDGFAATAKIGLPRWTLLSGMCSMPISAGFPKLGRHAHANRKTASGRLPDFLAVGPPRTATTWLHRLLRGRVNLAERSKETRFFDDRFRRGLDWYAQHFEHARAGIPTGEMAPTYFHNRAARRRIADSLPRVKIIVSLREPVERLYSLYRLKLSAGLLRGSFLESLRGDPEMIESARYVFHLSDWLRLFGREQVLVLIYEDLLNEPAQYAARIFDHIGLPRENLPADEFAPIHASESLRLPRHPVWKKLAIQARDTMFVHGFARPRRLLRLLRARRLLEIAIERNGLAIPPLDPELRASLRKQFESEVEGVEGILGRALAIWKTP